MQNKIKHNACIVFMVVEDYKNGRVCYPNIAFLVFWHFNMTSIYERQKKIVYDRETSISLRQRNNFFRYFILYFFWQKRHTFKQPKAEKPEKHFANEKLYLSKTMAFEVKQQKKAIKYVCQWNLKNEKCLILFLRLSTRLASTSNTEKKCTCIDRMAFHFQVN